MSILLPGAKWIWRDHWKHIFLMMQSQDTWMTMSEEQYDILYVF